MHGTFDEAGRESIRFTPLEAIAVFREGAVPESRDFDFLVGDWTATGTRFDARGSVLLEYKGRWHAEHLCERRMILDHFTAEVDGGGPFAFFATLRTWSPLSRRWEMTFLSAMQPHLLDSFTGRRVGDEMHLEASGRDGDGTAVLARVRFHSITDSSFSWEQTGSRDGGRSWHLEARIEATRLG